MNMELRTLGSDERYDYYLVLIQNKPLTVGWRRETGDIVFVERDVIRFLGYESLELFLATDLGLDVINLVKRALPGKINLKIKKI